MSGLLRLVLVGLVLIVGLVAEARVFDFNQESFAPYLRGSFQMATNFQQSAFAPSSGSGNSFGSSYSFGSNYELGMVYSAGQVTLRFGFEVIKPSALKDISATSSGGTELFKVDNDITGYAPKIGVDMNVKQWPRSRLFLAAAAGWATVTVQNSYGFTSAGSGMYALSDFREEVKGSALLYEYAIGYETLAFDTTTILIDVGYRGLNVASFTHNLPVTGFQGAVVKGDSAKDSQGLERTLDLSGYFASISFRFWVF